MKMLENEATVKIENYLNDVFNNELDFEVVYAFKNESSDKLNVVINLNSVLTLEDLLALSSALGTERLHIEPESLVGRGGDGFETTTWTKVTVEDAYVEDLEDYEDTVEMEPITSAF